MNFGEIRFWLLLLTGLGVIASLRWLLGRTRSGLPPSFDRLALCALGMFLLCCVSWLTFAIFMVVGFCSYYGMKWILATHTKGHSYYLFILIPVLLLPLFYYKYSNFVVNGVLGLRVDYFRDLALPVGISFYTFQKISFVVDTLAFKHPLPTLLDYLNFASFFPMVVAGPIERRADLYPQVKEFKFRWNPAWLDEGAPWIVTGLFFKLCLADNLAEFVNRQSTTNAWAIWAANFLFGLRIYYDFAGYSLVAVGLGRCLGIRLTLNFLSPYCSRSIVEFWRRWHITLSQWFRDYVYIPLGGGRTRRWAFNIMVVFVLSGIWHGAGWNFAIWGTVHGTYLIINRLFSKKYTLPAFAAWLLTFLAAMWAWLGFYEVRSDALLAKMKASITPSAYSLAYLRAVPEQWSPSGRLTLMFFLVLTAVVLLLEWRSVRRRNEPFYYLRQPWVMYLLVLLTLLLSPGINNAFIYFAF